MASHVSWRPGEGFVRTPLAVPARSLAHTLEKSAALDHLLSKPLPTGGKKTMSSLADMAERARQMRARLRDRSDQAVAKMAAVDQRGTQALDAMEGIIAEHDKDVAALEAELRQMTNGQD